MYFKYAKYQYISTKRVLDFIFPKMISVKVSYTVKPEFAAQNKQNINAFLTDFKQLKQLKFLYNVYLQDDGLTFLHISMYENEEVQQTILSTPSFLAFQQQRDESGLSVSPSVERLSLFGSSLGVVS
ncbi:hypothetical protein [Pedobacter frigiditerrae]|uniref:hypothetical protein n=1 Tax=Pedobacter frigiditerrae TaxID=2530452 RepID=UPI0029319515|nr:hypothetical protein [Pedobacter frigiditerrae]